MFTKMSKIEATISELESSPSKLPDAEFFEEIFKLRGLANANWDYVRADAVETQDQYDLRDRIVSAEQRLMNLAADMPTPSIENIRLKMLIWMLDRHMPLDLEQQQSISDRLIASAFQDLTRITEENQDQWPVLKTVK